MLKDLDVSFIIVTNGQRDGLLCTIIEGIKYQNIPEYEIIVVGKSKIKENYPEVNYIEAKNLAESGVLGFTNNYNLILWDILIFYALNYRA